MVTTKNCIKILNLIRSFHLKQDLDCYKLSETMYNSFTCFCVLGVHSTIIIHLDSQSNLCTMRKENT